MLYSKFPASEPCSCNTCVQFCSRPGWWLVSEAREAIENGYAKRMMLEVSPDSSFGVLSPAFKGNEGYFALQDFSKNNCTFLQDDLCELFGKAFQPIECRFCHHTRLGMGLKCHFEVTRDWNTNKGKRLVKRWIKLSKIKPTEYPLLNFV